MPTAVARIQRRGCSRRLLASALPGADDAPVARPADQRGERAVDAAGDGAAGEAGDREGQESDGPDQPRPQEGGPVSAVEELMVLIGPGAGRRRLVRWRVAGARVGGPGAGRRRRPARRSTGCSR